MLNPTPFPREGREPNVALHIDSRIAQFAVDCLFKAIGSMPLDYFKFSERDFQAEIYHQCRNRFSPLKINRQFPNEVAVDHPITVTSESGKSTATALAQHGINIDYVIPDLLFHNPVNMASQWCVAELKRRNALTNAEAISNDLRKLISYVSGPLAFRHSVFILNNFSRDALAGGHGLNPGAIFQTIDIRGLLGAVLDAADHPQPEYLEIWVINPQPAAQNNQDPLFILERTFYDHNAVGMWRTQSYARRGNRLSFFF